MAIDTGVAQVVVRINADGGSLRVCAAPPGLVGLFREDPALKPGAKVLCASGAGHGVKALCASGARRGVKLALLLVLGAGAVCASTGAVPQSRPKPVVPEEQRVDINRASLEELLKVPGMTKTWAARIVRFRPYRSKNELLDKGIVSSEVYNRIKDYIVAHREKTGTKGPGT